MEEASAEAGLSSGTHVGRGGPGGDRAQAWDPCSWKRPWWSRGGCAAQARDPSRLASAQAGRGDVGCVPF